MRKSTIALLIAAALTLVGCGAGEAVEKATAAGAEKTVTFEVTGKKASTISYGVGADQAQDNGAKLPWTKELKSSDALLVAVVTAQSATESGTITCSIKVDGKEVKTNTSKGQYAVVTCATDGS